MALLKGPGSSHHSCHSPFSLASILVAAGAGKRGRMHARPGFALPGVPTAPSQMASPWDTPNAREPGTITGWPRSSDVQKPGLAGAVSLVSVIFRLKIRPLGTPGAAMVAAEVTRLVSDPNQEELLSGGQPSTYLPATLKIETLPFVPGQSSNLDN